MAPNPPDHRSAPEAIDVGASGPELHERAGQPAASRSAERGTLVVRPGAFLTAVILSCVAVGVAIYWLLRSMRI